MTNLPYALVLATCALLVGGYLVLLLFAKDYANLGIVVALVAGTAGGVISQRFSFPRGTRNSEEIATQRIHHTDKEVAHAALAAAAAAVAARKNTPDAATRISSGSEAEGGAEIGRTKASASPPVCDSTFPDEAAFAPAQAGAIVIAAKAGNVGELCRAIARPGAVVDEKDKVSGCRSLTMGAVS